MYSLLFVLTIATPALLPCATVMAQTHAPTTKAEEVSARVPDDQVDSPQSMKDSRALLAMKETTETELRILKEKNTLISEFQSSMLSIITWALGAVISTVILLVGASLFTNFKMYDKDLQRIKDDYEAKIKIFGSEIEANLAVLKRDTAAAQEVRSQQDLDRMLDQTSQVRSHFETVRASIENKLEGLIKTAASHDAIIDKMNRNTAGLTTELRRAESLIWEIKKIPSNFLLSCLQGLDAALLSDNNWDIEDFIEKIKNSLQTNFIDSNRTLDEEMLGFFEMRLVKLATVRPDDEHAIRTLLAQCQDKKSEIA